MKERTTHQEAARLVRLAAKTHIPNDACRLASLIPTILSHAYNPPQDAVFDAFIPLEVLKDVALSITKDMLELRNERGETPLFLDAQKGNAKIVDKLLRMGANPNTQLDISTQNSWGYESHFRYALEIAIDRGHVSVVEAFLESPKTDIEICHALSQAVEAPPSKHKNFIVQLLVKHGAIVKPGCFKLAISDFNDLSLLNLLSKSKKDLSAIPANAINLAADAENYAAVRWFLGTQQCNVNHVNAYGNTALHCIAQRKEGGSLFNHRTSLFERYFGYWPQDLYMTCLLRYYGGDLHIKNKNGQTPLGIWIDNVKNLKVSTAVHNVLKNREFIYGLCLFSGISMARIAALLKFPRFFDSRK